MAGAYSESTRCIKIKYTRDRSEHNQSFNLLCVLIFSQNAGSHHCFRLKKQQQKLVTIINEQFCFLQLYLVNQRTVSLLSITYSESRNSFASGIFMIRLPGKSCCEKCTYVRSVGQDDLFCQDNYSVSGCELLLLAVRRGRGSGRGRRGPGAGVGEGWGAYSNEA